MFGEVLRGDVVAAGLVLWRRGWEGGRLIRAWLGLSSAAVQQKHMIVILNIHVLVQSQTLSMQTCITCQSSRG